MIFDLRTKNHKLAIAKQISPIERIFYKNNCSLVQFVQAVILQNLRPSNFKSLKSPIPRFHTKKYEIMIMILLFLLTLKQACSPDCQRAQYAFKNSMIHVILQFTLLIAIRCVLHRCESQEIRC